MDEGAGGRRLPRLQRARRLTPVVGLALALAVFSACTPQPGQGQPAPSTASPSTSPSAVGDWPDEATTGVPAGTSLTPFSEECVITKPGTRIDAKTINCNLRIRAAGVVITRSVIKGSVNVRNPEDGFSFSITDSEVDAGQDLITGLGNANFTANRVEIKGGMRGAYCATNCLIENSYVHGQAGDPSGKAHLSGVRMTQKTTLRHNTIICDAPRTPPGSGCSAALTGYGGFAPVQDNLIEGNLIKSGTSSFCAFGGSTDGKRFSEEARDIRFIDNTFERGKTGKCGNLGAVSAFDPSAPGNVWEGNKWDDGEPLEPND